MTQIAEKLDEKLTTWDLQTALEVERMVAEIIELADNDVLDVLPSRAVVQEVLDMLDEDQKARRNLIGRSWPGRQTPPCTGGPETGPVTI